MKQAGIAFEEVVIPLHRPDSKQAILAHSPAGKLPVLHDGDVTVWDSIAILEHLTERRPDLLPEAGPARALCRSISAEMHSGFAALRRELPMDVAARLPGRGLSADCEADIARLCAIWQDARTRFGAQGPFLFGRFTLADAMYAPVCTRLRTYAIPLDGVPAAYVDAVLDLPAMRDWYAAAREEPWTIDV
jgi:glutathione S-transferase